MHDAQNQAVRMFGIVDQEIIEPLHRPKPEPTRQQLRPTMTQQRPTGHPFGSVGNGYREFLGESRASDARRDVVDGGVNIA